MTKNDIIRKAIADLAELGEDREELEFWKGFAEHLSEEEQAELIANFKDEIERLKKAKKSSTS